MTESKPAFHWKHLFYVANIIDYFRVYFLYLAIQNVDESLLFAAFYSGSYLLDCIDGIAARALGQESKLGYYLDMVIDRVSSCLCIHFAAQNVAVLFPEFGAYLSAFLYCTLVVVEIVAHGVVVYYSEVLGIHQKKMGFEYAVVRLYLNDKRILFWSCASFEVAMLSLIASQPSIAFVTLPGFLFRAVANVMRLYSAMLLDTGATSKTD